MQSIAFRGAAGLALFSAVVKRIPVVEFYGMHFASVSSSDRGSVAGGPQLPVGSWPPPCHAAPLPRSGACRQQRLQHLLDPVARTE